MYRCFAPVSVATTSCFVSTTLLVSRISALRIKDEVTTRKSTGQTVTIQLLRGMILNHKRRYARPRLRAALIPTKAI
jgi:hypothetical protein